MADYDLPTVMQALRAADAAGNVEDAQKLAVIAQRMSTQQGGGATTPDPHEGASYLGELGKGIVNAVSPLVSMGAQGIRNALSTVSSPETMARIDQNIAEQGDAFQKNMGGPAAVPSVGDISSPRDAGLYAASTLGGAIPAVAGTVLGGPLGGAAVQAGIAGKQTYDATGGDPLATAAGAALGGISGAIPSPFLKGAGSAYSTGLRAFGAPTFGGIATGLGNAGLQAAKGVGLGAAGGALVGAGAGALGDIPNAIHTGNPADAIPSIGQVADSAARGAVLGGAAGGLVRALPEAASATGRDAIAAGQEADANAANAAPELAKAGPEGAAGRLAERIQTEAGANDIKLGKNVEKGAANGDYQVLDNIHNDISEEMKATASAVKDQLDPAQAADFEDSMKRAGFQSTLRDARNKVKNIASPDDIAAIQDQVGHVQEGYHLVDLIHQSNLLTQMERKGPGGGISQYTDYAFPLTRGGSERAGGSGAKNLILAAELAHAYASPTTGIPYLVGGAGIAYGGRAIDAAMGNRATVNNFVKSNIGKATPLDFGDRPSIIAQRAAQSQAVDALSDPEAARLAQRERDLYFQKFQDNNPGVGGFLKDTVYDKLGLMPQDASTGVKQLLANGSINQAEHDAFHSSPKDLMQNNIGNHIIDMLDNLAGQGKIQRDPAWIARQQQGSMAPQSFAPQSAQSDQATPTAAPQSFAPQGQQGNTINNPQAYNAQAAANQARVTNAIARVSASSHPPAIKGAINDAAATIGRTNNRAAAQEVHDNLVKTLGPNPEAASLATQELKPLVSQIKHADQAAVDRARDGRPLTPVEKVDVAQKAENLVNHPSQSSLNEAFGPDAEVFQQMFAEYATGGRDPNVALKLALTDFEKWVKAGRLPIGKGLPDNKNNRMSDRGIQAAAD